MDCQGDADRGSRYDRDRLGSGQLDPALLGASHAAPRRVRRDADCRGNRPPGYGSRGFVDPGRRDHPDDPAPGARVFPSAATEEGVMNVSPEIVGELAPTRQLRTTINLGNTVLAQPGHRPARWRLGRADAGTGSA